MFATERHVSNFSWGVLTLCLAACSGGGGAPAPAVSTTQRPPAASLQPIQPANVAPSISGSPGGVVTVNQEYLFEPESSDPDDDNLLFNITNQPSWSAFDDETGRLSGTPTQGDAAVYENIQISVSDGTVSTSLAEFSIEVLQTAPGSVTLTWTAPTVNIDDSALTDLRAYKIYYGTSSGSYPNEVRVENPGVTTYVVDQLSANTYYFVATTINSANVESDFSNEAIKTIN